MNLMEQFKHSSRLLGACYLAVGLILLIFPGGSVRLISICFGVMILVQAVTMIVPNVRRRGTPDAMSMELFFGLVLALIGAYIVIRPDSIMKILTVLIGIYVLLHGLRQVQRGLYARQMQYGSWKLQIALAAVTLLLGLVVLLDPWRAVEITFRIVGLIFIYQGVTCLWIGRKW